jgi:NADH-quinone oxidoreductase subunit F
MSDLDLTSLHAELQHYAPLGRSGLLPALHATQRIYGWLPEQVAAEVAKSQQVPLADVHGVIEFYSMFYIEPVGKKIIRVCTDQACALKGGDGVLEHLCRHHNIQPGQTTSDGSLTIESAPCLGLCDHAPAALVNDEAETDINPDLHHYDLGIPASLVFGSLRELTLNCGNGRPTPLAEYGEYLSFRKALSMSPEEIVNEVKASGLVGRGGAASRLNQVEGATQR